jgi:hypothetical protein
MLIASAGAAVGIGLGLGVGDADGAGVGDAVEKGAGDPVGAEVGGAVGAGADVRPGVGGVVGFGGVDDGGAVAPAGDGVGEDGSRAGTPETDGFGEKEGELAGLGDAFGGWRTESGDGPKNDGAMSWILDRRPPRNGIFVIGGSSGRRADALTPRMASMSA